jgi:hypothetical protein
MAARTLLLLSSGIPTSSQCFVPML